LTSPHCQLCPVRAVFMSRHEQLSTWLIGAPVRKSVLTMLQIF
jgi:hypothetical protein